MKAFQATLVPVRELNALHFSDYLRKEAAATDYAGRTPGALKRACHDISKDMKK